MGLSRGNTRAYLVACLPGRETKNNIRREDGEEKKHGDTTAEAKTRSRPTQIGQTSQQRDSGGSIRAVHCLYGWGKWSKASRAAADCHFGRARCGVNFM
eukprot:scaffold264702_cov36-Attheya_sp.AAC.1